MKKLIYYLNPMNHRILTALLVLLFYSFNPPVVNDCHYFVSYDYVEENYVAFPETINVEDLSIADLYKSKKRIEVRNWKICVDSLGHFVITKMLLNPSDVYPSWRTQIVKSVIDSTGVKLYDENDNLVHTSIDSSGVYYAEMVSFNQMGYNNIIELSFPSPEEIDTLLANGFSVTEINPGVLQISNDTILTQLDTNNLKLLNAKVEGGIVESQVEKSFAEMTDGSLVLSESIQISRGVLLSGISVNYINKKTFSNYQIQDNNGVTSLGLSNVSIGKEESVEDSKQNSFTVTHTKRSSPELFQIFPNPADDAISIQLPFIDTGYLLHIAVFDMNGKMVRDLGKHLNGSTLQVDINNLTSGLYVIKASGSDKSFVQKFSKI